MTLTARDIMNSDPPTVTVHATVHEVAVLLAQKNICAVPVLDEGVLVGIITEGDLIDRVKQVHLPTLINILDAVISVGGSHQFEEDLRKVAACKASEIMTPTLISVGPDADLRKIATVLAEQHVSVVPVVGEERLLGLIDKSDVIRGMLLSNEA
ncbi:CBS domain containing membrane protein [Magnetococcus marinus MC-1]|uniref:CBS domain containing membrane protein n=1 Tax=Magnetococcus marinus (strain ATCC BAA-1437 / JCM 17883 / MC-1) TaxID=156889 RepID=A0L685_MAGMM|nr:CBS domain-containing protein [Magnetococcus marinus]ABK43478.1 CBS domain containing membrane protein [Magnetococcus marinus MC-1]